MDAQAQKPRIRKLRPRNGRSKMWECSLGRNDMAACMGTTPASAYAGWVMSFDWAARFGQPAFGSFVGLDGRGN